MLIDVRKVVVHVERDNEVGRRFYEAKGFTITKAFEEDFEGFMLKTVQMELTIQA